MQRVAIVGGGVAGLAAAFECERHRRDGKALDWQLLEATPRFGGNLSTTRHVAKDGEYILEDGPDGWVTEKPWARDLAVELGLGDDLLPCIEAGRQTYLFMEAAESDAQSADNRTEGAGEALHATAHNRAARLVPMPKRMRLMVPEDLLALEGSPLFPPSARRAYARELERANELRAAAPAHDESVASLVRRHFGEDVLRLVAAPLLSGVFGGDVERLSVRSAMPMFAEMEATHGSLIAGLQARLRERAGKPPLPTFTSLRRGMGSLTEALVAALPSERMRANTPVASVRQRSGGGWTLGLHGEVSGDGLPAFDHVLLATPAHVTQHLLGPVDPDAAALLPREASSAILVTFCWPQALARTFALPPGFGFLVPSRSTRNAPETTPRLLAGTFVDAKYPGRAPAGARCIRAFFGTSSAERLASADDATVAAAALHELRTILGPLPPPEQSLSTVRRWPRSLPQYAVGHRQRMIELKDRLERLPGLQLLGNALDGVGIPDLIRHARRAAGTLV